MIGMSARALRAVQTAAVLLAGTVAGCVDSGLPDRNLPREEALNRTYSYPAYQASPTSEVWDFGGRRWQALGTVETIAPTLLRQVANANGTVLFALNTDPEPYTQLYTPVGANRWRPIAAID